MRTRNEKPNGRLQDIADKTALIAEQTKAADQTAALIKKNAATAESSNNTKSRTKKLRAKVKKFTSTKKKAAAEQQPSLAKAITTDTTSTSDKPAVEKPQQSTPIDRTLFNSAEIKVADEAVAVIDNATNILTNAIDAKINGDSTLQDLQEQSALLKKHAAVFKKTPKNNPLNIQEEQASLLTDTTTDAFNAALEAFMLAKNTKYPPAAEQSTEKESGKKACDNFIDSVSHDFNKLKPSSKNYVNKVELLTNTIMATTKVLEDPSLPNNAAAKKLAKACSKTSGLTKVAKALGFLLATLTVVPLAVYGIFRCCNKKKPASVEKAYDGIEKAVTNSL